VFNGSCGDECVWKTDAALTANTAGSFSHGAVYWHFPKRGEQHADQIGGGVTGEELGPGDD
jgi:hypothetical protein